MVWVRPGREAARAGLYRILVTSTSAVPLNIYGIFQERQSQLTAEMSKCNSSAGVASFPGMSSVARQLGAEAPKWPLLSRG